MKQLFRSKEAGILLIIILVSAVITLKNPVFLTTENLLDLAKNNTVIGIVALGMLPVIITGELCPVMTAAVTIIRQVHGEFRRQSSLVFTIGCQRSFAGGLERALGVQVEPAAHCGDLGSMSITACCIIQAALDYQYPQCWIISADQGSWNSI